MNRDIFSYTGNLGQRYTQLMPVLTPELQCTSEFPFISHLEQRYISAVLSFKSMAFAIPENTANYGAKTA